MIAVDTSSLVAHLAGAGGKDADLVEAALRDRSACLPPVVLVELLSDPKLPKNLADALRQLPLLSPSEGYWQRAGSLRCLLISRGHKAKLADSLIAQSCLDHDVGLITRDVDFRHFVKVAGLNALP